MQLALAYSDRTELAVAIGLTRLRPRDTFSVTTVNRGERQLVFVNSNLDSITAHTSEGTRAKICLLDMTLVSPVSA